MKQIYAKYFQQIYCVLQLTWEARWLRG